MIVKVVFGVIQPTVFAAEKLNLWREGWGEIIRGQEEKMATAETLGFSPEQQRVYGQIAGFFGRAEKEYPVAAKQLVNVVGGLVGEQRTTKEKLQQGMGNIDVGLALIGDWLKETGAEGFEVKLGLGGGTKKAIGRRQVKFPTASDLIRVGGRVNVDLQKQIPPLLSSFSRQIRGGLDVGLPPRQIVGGLLSESVGSELSANGSANLRQALNKPLGGHFEWIREALGIADVAAQAGFTPKESVAKPVKLAEKEEPKRPSFSDSSVLTDVGKEREHNEDCVLVNEEVIVRSRGIDGVYILADGMGGHGAGEVASAIAVDVVNQQVGKREFARGVEQFSQLTSDEQQEWLSGVVNQANHAIFERRKATTNTAEKDMGTTLVMAVKFGDQVMIANVGDSRGYVVSADGRILTQITRDHSLVASLVAAGQITAAEARTHKQRNVIYRTMGDKPRVEVDVFSAKIPVGGSLLLCSDGLWEMVKDDQIRQIMVSSGSAQEATRRLIEAANAAGGEDNISAIVVKRGIKETLVGAEKPEEAELTLTEKVFAAMVEDLVGWEEGAGIIDSGKLQKAFENMRSQFGRLPAGGHFRAKVAETVMGQLGDEGEKMRKARKSDEQIFEEWLKRVFIPLYRRAGKKR